MSQDRQTAVHESGHVVANIHFGLRFEYVTLHKDGSGEVNLWDGQRPSNLQEAKPYAIAVFAGYAAEHVLLGTELIVEGEDWELYRLRVIPLFRREHRFDAFTDKMLRASVRLTKSRGLDVLAIADALCARRRLTEKEAQTILCKGGKRGNVTT